MKMTYFIYVLGAPGLSRRSRISVEVTGVTKKASFLSASGESSLFPTIASLFYHNDIVSAYHSIMLVSLRQRGAKLIIS